MKIEKGFILQEVKPYEINLELGRIKDVVNGHLQFGQTNGADRNIDGKMVSHTFAVANVEESVEHNLGTIPIGYLVLRNGNGGVIFDGITRTSKTEIFLRSTTANNTVLLFILR